MLGSDAAAALVTLFRVGGSVAIEEAERSLAPLDLGALARAGLLRRRGGRVHSPVRIVPFEGLLLAHDPEEGRLARDHVAGIGPATRTLAGLTVRRPAGSALDLGTGCGVQALLAARHAERVVAVDVSTRAVRFAKLNARLNGVGNVDCREGSLFQPVRDCVFELLVANPPFVVSPGIEYVFRDGGAAGDAISEAVVSQAPGFLREGGFAHVLSNWILRGGDGWEDAPRRWIEGRGCDAWLLHYQTEDPLSYAEKWNQHLRAADPDGFVETLERWVGHYRRQGIDAIATGAVVLRSREGRNWVRADEMPLGPSGSAGDHVLRVFEAHDFLQGIRDDSALLEEALRPAAAHRLEQVLPYRDGAYAIGESRLLLDDGVGLVRSVSPQGAHVLFLLDGRRALGEVLDEAGADASVLGEVRRLLELGYLVREPKR